MNLLKANPHLPQNKFAYNDALGPVPTAQEDMELRRLQQIWNLREESHPALNGQGFIRFVDALGTDDRIVEAARLTAQSEGHDFDDDRQLLRYLMRHLHTTPVEFGEIVVHIRVPMDCWRQWVRHRTATINEFSTRYSSAIDEKATTLPDQWRLQSKGNRQGSSGSTVSEWPAGYSVQDVKHTTPEDPQLYCVDRGQGSPWKTPLGSLYTEPPTPGQYLSDQEALLQSIASEGYAERLLFGVANEVARKDLPLSTFTEAYWKIDLHNLLHFLSLRMDAHAQQEIREYATIVGEQFVARLFPVTWEAFKDYRLLAVRLTRLDKEVIQRLTSAASEAMAEEYATQGLDARDVLAYSPPWSAKVFMDHGQDPAWRDLSKCRERVECWAKLEALGLVALRDEEAVIS